MTSRTLFHNLSITLEKVVQNLVVVTCIHHSNLTEMTLSHLIILHIPYTTSLLFWPISGSYWRKQILHYLEFDLKMLFFAHNGVFHISFTELASFKKSTEFCFMKTLENCTEFHLKHQNHKLNSNNRIKSLHHTSPRSYNLVEWNEWNNNFTMLTC